MKGQGTGLWLLALGLIGVFMLATMVAPAILNPSQSGGSGNGGGNASQSLIFKAPTFDIGSSTQEQDESFGMTLSTIAASSTTGEGGNFAWMLSVEGANGQAGALQVKYGDQMVQWYSGGNGVLVGLGPRFTQGPGAVPVEVVASFNVTAAVAGSYTIDVWIAQTGQVVTLDPSGLKASSPTQSQDITINKRINPNVSVTQNLRGPSTAIMGRAVTFTIDSSATAEGKWNGSLIDRIIVLKGGIKSADVTVKVGGATIPMTSTGGGLIGDLQTVRPFKGEAKSETAEWSVTVEITFKTAGDYTIQGSSADSVSKKVLYTTAGQVIKVSKSILSSNTSSDSSNSTSSPPAVNTTAPASPSAPAVDSSAATKTDSPVPTAPSNTTATPTNANK